jgi:hypothetical protein
MSRTDAVKTLVILLALWQSYVRNSFTLCYLRAMIRSQIAQQRRRAVCCSPYQSHLESTHIPSPHRSNGMTQRQSRQHRSARKLSGRVRCSRLCAWDFRRSYRVLKQDDSLIFACAHNHGSGCKPAFASSRTITSRVALNCQSLDFLAARSNTWSAFCSLESESISNCDKTCKRISSNLAWKSDADAD